MAEDTSTPDRSAVMAELYKRYQSGQLSAEQGAIVKEMERRGLFGQQQPQTGYSAAIPPVTTTPSEQTPPQQVMRDADARQPEVVNRPAPGQLWDVRSNRAQLPGGDQEPGLQDVPLFVPIAPEAQQAVLQSPVTLPTALGAIAGPPGVLAGEALRQTTLPASQQGPTPISGDNPILQPVERALRQPGVVPAMAMGTVLPFLPQGPGYGNAALRTLGGATAATGGELVRRGMTGEPISAEHTASDFLTNLVLQGGPEFALQAGRQLLAATPPAKLYEANQQRQGLQGQIDDLGKQIDRTLGEASQQGAALKTEMDQLVGAGMQQETGLQDALKQYGKGVKGDIEQVRQTSQQIGEGYGTLRVSLQQIDADAKAQANLARLQIGQAREQNAMDARNWLKTLPVPTDEDVNKLYARVDQFNGERVPQVVMDELDAARRKIAAKEERIAAVVPEAANASQKRLGKAPAGASAPVVEEAAPTPTFRGVRETLTRLGQQIGDLRTAANMGDPAAREKLASVSSLYRALQTGLDKAIESGGMTEAAKKALTEANAAFKVQATTKDLAGLIESAIRTPEGGAPVFNPAKVIDALRKPENKDLVAKLHDIGVYDSLTKTLGGMQGKIAAPRDAIRQASELRETARQLAKSLSQEERVALQKYADSEAAMRSNLASAQELMADELAAMRQQTQAGEGMLKEAQSRVAMEGEAKAGMLKGQQQQLQQQQDAIQVPSAGGNALLPYGLVGVPAAIGAAMGQGGLGVGIGLGLEFSHLLARGLMTPAGQELVGRVMAASGGVNTAPAMVTLYRLLKPTAVAQGTQDYIEGVGKGKR